MVYLFIVLFISCLLCWLYVCYYLNIVLTIKILSSSSKFWLLTWTVDDISILILLMLLICFFYVYNYTKHYFGYNNVGKYLKRIICLFVFVMGCLVCTSDYLLRLIFWEYLGVTSFFLILFYNNYLSLRSSIITLVSSRFGDVCLFLLLCVSGYYFFKKVLLILFFFIIFTKRAGFPFISWLLEAMRAPTPVSSLVHSSTLVAAGVWFFMRYNVVSYFDKLLYIRLLLLITIFITGISSFFFVDLKKIVALSTCKKISWCILYLVLGDYLLSLFQLIRHGVSKCMLFMLIGDTMKGRNGSQSINCIYKTYLYNNWKIFSLFCIILGLSGAPYIGVFYTKHFFLIKFMNVLKLTLWFFVIIGVFLSYVYSFRLCRILIKIRFGLVSGVYQIFNTSLIVYFWLFTKFLYFFLLDEKVVIKKLTRVTLLIFQLISFILAYFLYKSIIFRGWRSSLFGCDKIVEMFYQIFMNLHKFIALFFYRWDYYVMLQLNNLNRYRFKSVYGKNIINLTIAIVILFLMCFYILY